MGRHAKSNRVKESREEINDTMTAGGPSPNPMFKNWENLVNTY